MDTLPTNAIGTIPNTALLSSSTASTIDVYLLQTQHLLTSNSGDFHAAHLSVEAFSRFSALSSRPPSVSLAKLRTIDPKLKEACLEKRTF
jgi:hypothetical protein